MSVPTYYWVTYVLLPIAGGLLAAAGFIIAKNQNAQKLIDRLTPYKASIGLGMFAVGIWNLTHWLSGFSLLFKSLFGIGIFTTIVCMVVVGFLLGFGLIAKWIPGEGAAETRALDVQKKLIKLEVPLGFVTIGGPPS